MAPAPEVLPPLLKQLREKAVSLDLSEASTKALVTYARTRSVNERKEIVALIETYEKNAAFASSKGQLGKLKTKVNPTFTESAAHAVGEARDVAGQAVGEVKKVIEKQAPVVKAVALEQLNDAKDAFINEVGSAYLEAKKGNWVGAAGHGLTIAAPVGIAAWFGIPMLRDSWSQVGAKDGFFANVWQFVKALFTTAAVATGGVLLVNASRNIADRYQHHSRVLEAKKSATPSSPSPSDTPSGKKPPAAAETPAKPEKLADASGFTRFEELPNGSLFGRKAGFESGGKRMLVTFVKSGDSIYVEREDLATGTKKKFKVSANVVELDGARQPDAKPGDTSRTEVASIEKKGKNLSLTSVYTDPAAWMFKGPYTTVLAIDGGSLGRAMDALSKNAGSKVECDLSGTVDTTDAPGASGYKNGSSVKCRFIFS